MNVCECVERCDEDPRTACGLAGRPHVHPGERCPVHPDAPGDWSAEDLEAEGLLP